MGLGPLELTVHNMICIKATWVWTIRVSFSHISIISAYEFKTICELLYIVDIRHWSLDKLLVVPTYISDVIRQAS